MVPETDPRIVPDDIAESTIQKHRQRKMKISDNKRNQVEQKLKEATYNLEREKVQAEQNQQLFKEMQKKNLTGNGMLIESDGSILPIMPPNGDKLPSMQNEQVSFIKYK